MILKRLVLENYKQHSAFDRTFPGNIIGIIGDNHTGKSNLLGALHFVFAGEQPGFKKADLLQWGKPTGCVELWFTHNNTEGYIYRSLNTANAEFVYGTTKYSGITKVAQGITEHLGLDKELLKTVFVRQSEIDAVLFEDASVRELAFQRLCGIGEATKVHKKLGDILGALATPPNYDEQIAEGTLRHSQMQAKVNELRAAQTTMEAQRASCPSASQLQTQITAVERTRASCKRLAELITATDQYNAGIAASTAELATLPTEVLDLTETDKSIEETRNMIVQANNYAKALQNWETVGKQLVAMGDTPVKPEPVYKKEQIEYLQKTVAELSAVYNDAVGNLKLYKGVLAACKGVLTKDATCPLCGNQITDTGYLDTRIKLLEEKVTTTNPQKCQQDLNVAVSTNLSNEQLFERELVKYKATYEGLTKQFVDAEKALDSVKEYAAIKDQVVQLTTRLNVLNDQRRAFLATTTRRTTLQAQIKSVQGYLADMARTIEAERMSTPGLTAITAPAIAAEELDATRKLESLNKALTEIRAIDDQLSTLSGMLIATDSGLQELTKTLKDLEDRRSKQGAYREALEVLGQVRDWFHYANGPHTLANSVLNNMTADVNSFLEKFGALFTVVPGNDALGFKYVPTDGTVVPNEYPDAIHLSGGQKIQLAIAFRFAAYCMFASKVGLLSLDEPSIHLDEKNIGNLFVLMERIRDVAQKMDLQILISTHETSLLPVFDAVINLNDTRIPTTTVNSK